MPLMRVRGPDPHVYCSVDYAALEMCTLGQVNLWRQGFSRIAEAINAGQDLHTRLAARIGGKTYLEMLGLVKAGDKWALNLRKLAKPINFGLPGGMGAPTLVLSARKQKVRFCELSGQLPVGACGSEGKLTRWKAGRQERPISPTCTICLDLAVGYKKVWLSEWEEMEDYLKWAGQIADDGGLVESFGNGMLRGDCNYNSAANHFFQNLAAQGAKRAGWLIAREAYTDRRSPLFNNLRVVVFVHDENLSEIREAVLHECAYRKAELMVGAMQEFVPDVKITAKPAAARRWFKGMEEVHDKVGRLKPWWPKDWSWAPDRELMLADMAA